MYKDIWESSVAKITQTSGSVFTLSFVQVLYTNPALLACCMCSRYMMVSAVMWGIKRPL